MTYTLPGSVIVYEPEKQAAEKLRSDSRYQEYVFEDDAVLTNTPLEKLLEVDPDALPAGGPGVPFLHHRQSPAGHERLVLVDFEYNCDHLEQGMWACAYVLRPATLTRRLTSV